MPCGYSPSNANNHSPFIHLYCIPVLRLVVYMVFSVFSLESNTMFHLVPVHSTISFAPATKSDPSAFFQASAPSSLSLSPMDSSNKSIFIPTCFKFTGLVLSGSIIKLILLFSPVSPVRIVSVGKVSLSQFTVIV